MQCRKPIVAGQFYPAQNDSCVDEINQYLNERTSSQTLPERIAAGIVPHAGWFFSGSLAALVFSAIKLQNNKVHTFVIFGAAHSFFGQRAAVYDRGCWQTPVGEIFIDEQLAEAVIASGTAVSGPDAHRGEHSIEVQVPFIQYLFAGAKLVPILATPGIQAVALGEALGEIISKDTERIIVCIGSTDLTHYGPRYGFTPMGVGNNAIEWASQVNDRQFIDLALNLEPQAMLTSAAENGNACGAGAAAAAVAAAKKLGRKKGVLLAQTNSRDVMLEKMNTSSAESVGYAAIVF
jgi:AmmeMemoRadiSam system protein B